MYRKIAFRSVAIATGAGVMFFQHRRNSFSVPSLLSYSDPDENISIRPFELAVLQRKLRVGKLYVLTGPKEVGKTFLVRELKNKNSHVIYIDLKAKSTVNEIRTHTNKQLEEYNLKNKVLEEETLTAKLGVSTNSAESAIESVKKYKSGDISTEEASPLRALQVSIDRELSKFYIIEPSVVIIDEAQTLELLSQPDRRAFFDYLSAATRDGKLAVLLVTSDFDHLFSLAG